MSYSARYNHGYPQNRREDNNDYTSDTIDWPSDERSNWNSAPSRAPQKYHKPRNKRYPWHNPKSDNSTASSVPQSPQKEYAPEWYAPNRNSTELASATQYATDYTADQQEHNLDNYPAGNEERFENSGEPEWDACEPVPQQPGVSIVDSIVAEAQHVSVKHDKRKMKLKKRYEAQKAKHRSKREEKLARAQRWREGTQTEEDIAARKKQQEIEQGARLSKAERIAALSQSAQNHRLAQMRAKERNMMAMMRMMN